MVGIVVVSHSQKVAEGAVELARQMAPEAKIAAAGGMEDGSIGTDVSKILAGIEAVQDGDGVVILVDLGSAVMSSEMAIEMLEDSSQVKIIDAPIVEGTIFSSVEASIGSSFDEVIEVLAGAKSYKKF
ncbi:MULTISPECIES: dihydroxyacetone kinase phosphoryl donor subunit DhaM [unclassified Acetobacterium]|jgi:dihydroxyacetone kinase phosphotransfer subunit|uniref:dihydroxyacetone kinase phosphoryl donor subunit DhaM n=1 Tax=unclassified Acetobacterium TaxID=2638182 RepID=UPI000DBEBD75|nr:MULTISPECIES: dihydroxyacetone kinase phosphoryl donor subunit DhaM [unclassified Acetobacterium]AWW25588.1 PTS mannose transporter subunit IID [Acetobacterium sp. KB-1]MDZ5724534.1 dihydroxyacetone kinase phosphoryl donor subunit DhaM [Acetobacterium sp. K1/6]